MLNQENFFQVAWYLNMSKINHLGTDSGSLNQRWLLSRLEPIFSLPHTDCYPAGLSPQRPPHLPKACFGGRLKNKINLPACSKQRGSLRYHTFFTSKFSCTGGDGHFPRWKLCPLAAVKRLASVARSNSMVTISGLGSFRRGLGRNKAAGCIWVS